MIIYAQNVGNAIYFVYLIEGKKSDIGLSKVVLFQLYPSSLLGCHGRPPICLQPHFKVSPISELILAALI